MCGLMRLGWIFEQSQWTWFVQGPGFLQTALPVTSAFCQTKGGDFDQRADFLYNLMFLACREADEERAGYKRGICGWFGRN